MTSRSHLTARGVAYNGKPCSPRFVTWLVSLAVCITMVATAMSARADIPPPQPTTLWGKNQAPDKMHILAAGIFISAAVIAAGLIVAWQVGLKSRRGKTGLAVFMALLVGAVLLTVALPLRIQWEN